VITHHSAPASRSIIQLPEPDFFQESRARRRSWLRICQ